MKLFDIISNINSDEKFSAQKGRGGAVYQDEPIIFKASDMKNYTPPQYRNMRRLEGCSDNIFISPAEMFYRQGKYMETFEDSVAEIKEVVEYYPTYRTLSTEQLRSYFTWRAAVRQGEYAEGCLTFAYLYMYELINLIGVHSAKEGFERLCTFSEKYGSINSKINYYATRWLRDFAIYYELGEAFLSRCVCSEIYVHINALLDGSDRRSVFSALNYFSSYKPVKSAFYKLFSEEFENALYKTYLFLCSAYAKGDRKIFTEFFIAHRDVLPYYMFNGAVFYEQNRHTDGVYKINGAIEFECRAGKWTYSAYRPSQTKKLRLGLIIKYLEAVLRDSFSFSFHLKKTELPLPISDELSKIAAAVFDEKCRRERPEVEIDISKLQKIRDTAQLTQNKLIVDEEPCDAVPQLGEALPESPVQGEPLQKMFLCCLLENRDYSTLLRQNGVMLSVLAEEINEEYFDAFGDNVIVFDGDAPALAEDYKEDLRGLINT